MLLFNSVAKGRIYCIKQNYDGEAILEFCFIIDPKPFKPGLVKVTLA